ncbi:hypothetical protein [Fodinibius sp. SL11]|uniref:hypothetical protein n=1 Tax=Fodinibius sp. SL11 TaxID=3425690 RepID=UPI003F88265D
MTTTTQADQSNLLLSILCSSFNISRYVDEGEGDLSIADLAVDLCKIGETYDNQWITSLKEFDGYTSERVEATAFQRRLTKLGDKYSQLAENVKRNIPSPLIEQKDGKTKRVTFLENEEIDKSINHELVQKWLKKYNKLGGKSCYQFSQSALGSLQVHLEEIAQYKIKYEAMKHVEDRAMLTGSFTFDRTFSSVPEACRWLDDQIEGVTFEKLKNEIRSERIVIQNGDEVLDDPEKLYDNVYSWYKNQVEQGRIIPFD